MLSNKGPKCDLFLLYFVVSYTECSDARTGGGAGRPLLADQLTLFQTGRADIPTYCYRHPQYFSPSGITESRMNLYLLHVITQSKK